MKFDNRSAKKESNKRFDIKTRIENAKKTNRRTLLYSSVTAAIPFLVGEFAYLVQRVLPKTDDPVTQSDVLQFSLIPAGICYLTRRFLTGFEAGPFRENWKAFFLGLKAFYHDINLDKEKEAQALEEIVKIPINPLIEHELRAQIHRNRNEYDKMIEHLLLMFNLSREYGIKRSLFDRATGKLAALSSRMFHRQASDEAQGYLDDICLSTRFGKIDRVPHGLEKLSELMPEAQIELGILRALVLEKTGKASESLTQYRKVLDMLTEKGLEFEKQFESRNEVLVYSPKSCIRDALIFKRNREDSSRIRREYVINSSIYDFLLDFALRNGLDLDFVKVALSLKLLQNPRDRLLYHVMKRNNVQSAEEFLKENPEKSREILERILETEAIVTGLTTQRIRETGYILHRNGDGEKLGRYDYFRAFEGKLVARVGENRFLGKLRDSYKEIVKEIELLTDQNNLFFFSHGDSTLANFLIDGTMIDMEHASIADPTRDLAMIIDHPFLPIDRDLFDFYRNQFEHYTRRIINRDILRKLFHLNRICNTILRFGGRIAYGKKDQATFFYNRLQELDNRAAKAFKLYLQKSGVLENT